MNFIVYSYDKLGKDKQIYLALSIDISSYDSRANSTFFEEKAI